jgi:AraC family transcriptional regulator
VAQAPRHPQIRTIDIVDEPLALRDACLLLLVSGELRARDEEGECVSVGPGDLVTVPTGGHCDLIARGRPAEIVWFHAGDAWAREAAALAGVEMEPSGAHFHVDRVGSDTARRATRIVRELDSTRRREGQPRALVETSRHLELLAIAVTPRPSTLAPNARRGGARARALRARFLERVGELESQPLEDVSLASLAEALGTSERHASRLFRTELGTTFREHVAGLRLERAKRLLRETDLPVIEVAAEAGWSSLGHFTTTFRRRIGLTPTGYRAAAESPQAA